jgi:peptidoglycan/LPS O-acetylase OafA/YrhL
LVKRIPTLDGRRALAIAAVMLHHAGMGFYSVESIYWTNSKTIFGSFGVDIFFGLSGFLITRLLLDEWDRTGAVDLRAFYTRRAFRILPPYLVFLLAITVAGLWTSGWEAAGCLFFFRNYVPAPLGSWSTGHFWSLSVEEHFYLIWPALLLWVGRKKGANAAAGFALAIGLWRMIESQSGLGLFPQVPPHFRTDLRLDALLWGCVTAFMVSAEPSRTRLARQLRLGSWTVVVALAVLSVYYYSPASSMMLAVLIPAALAGTALHPEWIVSRLLESPALRWLGRISYSLYLWQQLFLIPGWAKPVHWWQHFPANIAAPIAIAALSYFLLEKPMLEWGRRLAARGTRAFLVEAPQQA